jgi:hypothetical protein
MTRSELFRERRRLLALLDALPPAGAAFGALSRARELKAAPIRQRLAEIERGIGPIKLFVPRPMTAADRRIARQYKPENTASFNW